MFSLPFDSKITGYDSNGIPQYDRASGSAEFARLLAAFLTNGVFGSGMFAVTAKTGMQVEVSAGSCVIGGRFGFAIVPETLTVAADVQYPRIHSVVLRMDVAEPVRDIHLEVHQGTPSPAPQAPALTRDGTVWELGLANVLIPAGSTAIAQERITDTRLDTSRCGIVAAINSKIDTTALYNQIQADLASFKGTEQAGFEAWRENEQAVFGAWKETEQAGFDAWKETEQSRFGAWKETEQNEFEAWFANIKDMLEGDIVGNLLSQIEGKATTATYSATLTAAGWSASAPYTQTASAAGVLSTDDPFVDVDMSGASGSAQGAALTEAWGFVGRVTAGSGKITAYCYEEKPAVNLPVILKVVR